tara:strand:- start:1493 stop:1990 length:498 start_codon:yes stop_codon:yes gene_type:complete
MRFLKGDVIANAKVEIKDGYQLLYSNPTLLGMSGGSVINFNGELVGIHGRAEIQGQVSRELDKLVATGTNKAVPINYYQQYLSGQILTKTTNKASTLDDYFALIETRIGSKGKGREIIYLAKKSIKIEPSALGYFYLALGKSQLKDYEGAIKGLNTIKKLSIKYF